MPGQKLVTLPFLRNDSLYNHGSNSPSSSFNSILGGYWKGNIFRILFGTAHFSAFLIICGQTAYSRFDVKFKQNAARDLKQWQEQVSIQHEFGSHVLLEIRP